MATAIAWIGSPNRTKGRRGFRPEAIVVHIMDGTLAGTDAWFRNPASKVSAHYGVGKGGAIHQYVGESDTAYHAGRVSEPVWTLLKPDTNPNLYTVGIEHEGTADSIWPDALYTSSARLIAAVCNRWSIPIDRAHVVGHREIYARKVCPGNTVDLEHLVGLARDVALAPEPYNFVRQSGRTRTRLPLHVRRGAPTVLVPIVRTVPVAALLQYTGWTSNGLAVHGNAHWYRDADGNYFWAGGTEQPTPGVSAVRRRRL